MAVKGLWKSVDFRGGSAFLNSHPLFSYLQQLCPVSELSNKGFPQQLLRSGCAGYFPAQCLNEPWRVGPAAVGV